MTQITFEHVVKRFGSVTAVNDVSLTVGDGEFVALLGPSGCGKTTTLRLVAGLEFADSGRVLIGERDVTRLPPRARDVAMVFQDYALYPHMTLLENIGYPLKVRGIEDLAAINPDLPRKYRDEFAAGLDLMILGYERKDPSMYFQGQVLDRKFDAWRGAAGLGPR